MRNAGHVVSRGQILDHVWEYSFSGESTVVETFMSSLRKKVDTVGRPLIKTVAVSAIASIDTERE